MVRSVCVPSCDRGAVDISSALNAQKSALECHADLRYIHGMDSTVRPVSRLGRPGVTGPAASVWALFDLYAGHGLAAPASGDIAVAVGTVKRTPFPSAASERGILREQDDGALRGFRERLPGPVLVAHDVRLVDECAASTTLLRASSGCPEEAVGDAVSLDPASSSVHGPGTGAVHG